VQKINIDGSFISQVTENYQDAAIVSAIVAMGQKLKLEVNAGGIENREQLNFMKNLNCANFSGRLFSDALNPDDFRNLLTEKRIFSQYFSL
ncbi:MAG TPA: EAL domain-containing protein, partial [Leptospiraceae bacterium]|nr:EAL domain-containing protein [Leptospiraceae bacterium]